MAADQGLLNYEDLTKNLDNQALSKLTKTEIEVLGSMTRNNAEKNTIQEIALDLSESPNTISAHFQSITKKTNLNRIQAGLLYASLLRIKAKETNSLVKEKNSNKKTATLTAREMKVLEGIAKGELTKDTASLLQISPNTLRTHKRTIYKKLGAKNGAEAVVIGFGLKILPIENPPDNQNTSAPFREVVVYQRRREQL